MVNFLITLFGVYTAFKIFLEIKEVIFIKNEFKQGPVLLDLESFKDAAFYAITKHSINILNALISLFLVVFWLEGGLFIINFLLYKENSTTSQLEILALFFTINYILTIPIFIWEKYVDKKFGFNKQSIKELIIDEIKKIALFAIFGGAFFYALIYIIDNFQNWWIWGFSISFITVILINLLYPYIASLFYKFEPLKDENLKNQIEEMMKKVGFKSNGIYVMNASSKDSRLNAYFAGLGRSKRVVLFDTLINKLSPNEILAVLGHELGHFKHKDLIKNIAIVGVMLFILFFIFGNLPSSLFKEIGVPKNGANIIAMIILFMELVLFIISPITNYISQKNEFNADKMGANLVDNSSLISALKKLVSENRHFPKVSKIYSIFHYSHPPILDRLEKLKNEN